MMQTGPMETNEASTRLAVATPSNSPKRGILGADLLLRLLAGADLLLRFLAAGATLGGAISMGTTDQSFSLQAFQFRATYNDLPMFTFFVVANSIAGGYLFLSLPVSVFNIIRSTARISKLILIIFDTVVVALLASGASAAAAIAYLAHKGNANANWLAFCQQFDNFCERISGSLIGSFVAVVFLSVMIISSAFALSQNVTIQ